MNYFSLLIFAILPSFLWLFYFLKKDIHPEPKRYIVWVFFVGGLFAIVGLLFQQTASSLLFLLAEGSSYFLFFSLFYKFFIVALSEEGLKYLTFFFTVKDDKELDEPIDFVIYMITAALGFAAVENFLLLSSDQISLYRMIEISVIRFTTATFLHALVSGTLGAFLAFAYYYSKKYLVFWGIIVVTFLHGVYNLIAENVNIPFYFYFLLAFLLTLAVVLTLLIEKVKKIKTTNS
jgi:protease PrsW